MVMIGTKCQLEQVVTQELTAAAIGSGMLPVFGTPFMAAMMENAALTALQSFLEEGQGSVGTRLDKGPIGGGTHTRAIINTQRFLDKCNGKLNV